MTKRNFIFDIQRMNESNIYALGWVKCLQIQLKHSVSRVLYFLSSEKMSVFDISKLLSILSIYSSGSKLIIFGLELLGMIFSKLLHGERQRCRFWHFCAQLISIICTILDSEDQGLSIKIVLAKSKTSTHSNMHESSISWSINMVSFHIRHIVVLGAVGFMFFHILRGIEKVRKKQVG